MSEKAKMFWTTVVGLLGALTLVVGCFGLSVWVMSW